MSKKGINEENKKAFDEFKGYQGARKNFSFQDVEMDILNNNYTEMRESGRCNTEDFVRLGSYRAGYGNDAFSVDSESGRLRGLSKLMQTVGSKSEKVAMDLSDCLLNESLKDFAKGLSSVKNESKLKMLDLRGNQIESDTISSVMRALPDGVTNLYLQSNRIGNEAVSNIVSKPSLKVLSLGQNPIFYTRSVFGRDGIRDLSNSLNSSSNNLEALGLGYMGLDSAGMSVLAEGLKTNDKLETLFLSGNKIGDTGVKELAKTLVQNQNLALEKLYLDENQITSQGAISLFRALEKNQSLAKLSLANNQKSKGFSELKIDDGIANALCSALNNNQSLLSLDLSGSKITDRTVDGISQLIEEGSNRSIVEIKIDNTLVSEASKERLEKALKGIHRQVESEINFPINSVLEQINNDGGLGGVNVANFLANQQEEEKKDDNRKISGEEVKTSNVEEDDVEKEGEESDEEIIIPATLTNNDDGLGEESDDEVIIPVTKTNNDVGKEGEESDDEIIIPVTKTNNDVEKEGEESDDEIIIPVKQVQKHTSAAAKYLQKKQRQNENTGSYLLYTTNLTTLGASFEIDTERQITDVNSQVQKIDNHEMTGDGRTKIEKDVEEVTKGVNVKGRKSMYEKANFIGGEESDDDIIIPVTKSEKTPSTDVVDRGSSTSSLKEQEHSSEAGMGG